MGLFGQMGQMYKMQKEAKRIKGKLEKMHIEAEVEGIIVTVSGEQKLIKVSIPENFLDPSKKKELEEKLLKVCNKGFEKAQQVAAEEMKDIMGSFGGLT